MLQGKLRGCFALTELGLGVLSGSTVRTRLLDAPGGGFLLHNADDAAAAKVWISCGEAQALQGQALSRSLTLLQLLTLNSSLQLSSRITSRSA